MEGGKGTVSLDTSEDTVRCKDEVQAVEAGSKKGTSELVRSCSEAEWELGGQEFWSANGVLCSRSVVGI